MPSTFLDTNALNNNYSLDGENFTLLKDYISRNLGEVYISEVTVREHARHHSNAAKALADSIALTSKKYGRPITFKGSKLPVDFISEKAYIKFLRKRLHHLGVQVLELPLPTVEEILSRDLNKIKPFDDKGKGFRDFLIWKSVLQHISLNPGVTECYFVSSNSSDFSEESGALHATLRDEVAEIADDVLLKLYPKLPEFVEQIIKPAVAAADEDEAKTAELLTTINGGGFFKLNVEQLVADEIEIFEKQEVNGPAYFESVLLEEPIEISALEEISQVAVKNLYRLSSGQFLCEGTATARGRVTGYMYSRDLWPILPDDRIYVYDANWNEHMSAVEIYEVRIDVTFSFRIDETNGEVADFELSELELAMNDQSGNLEFGFQEAID